MRNSRAVSSIIINGVPTVDDQLIANALVSQFAQAHSEKPLTCSLAQSRRNLAAYNNILNSAEDGDLTFSADQIASVISSRPSRKTPGFDGVTNLLLKQIPMDCLEAYATLFNESVR